MGAFKNFVLNLPEVAAPTQKSLPFKQKMKWTVITLVLFFILGAISLYGLDPSSELQFEQLQVLLGASFGSIISLGIGPIVTASIVLQLLGGAGIINIDNKTPEGKQFYQGVQKLMAVGFILLEAIIYVMMGGLSPDPSRFAGAQFVQVQLLIIFQLILGGFMILFMDEVVQKWGIGSGVSLFIAAGVSQSLFVRLLSPVVPEGADIAVGAIPALVQSFILQRTQDAVLNFARIAATVAVFVMAVYAQAMKVEIPLSFGRVRGHGIRWPLKFIYTSNIPVILVAALLANLQLMAQLLYNWGKPILGTFSQGAPQSGFVTWIVAPQLMEGLLLGTVTGAEIFRAIIYMIIMMTGCVMFGFFWVQTSGMDAKSQAQQIMSSGLQIPGFRKDERVLERILKRYITPLTIMGAMTVGLLASVADISSALANGTGLLLTVMIIYRFYEDIAKQHMMEMNPAMRKFMGG
ncbi:MAG: preprotein translocase subunit SecY [Candidatus Woesearchaeota archaeon]